MNCRAPERNHFYLLSPETCGLPELDGEGSGSCSPSLPCPALSTGSTLHQVWAVLCGGAGAVQGQGSVCSSLLLCPAADFVRLLPSSCGWAWVSQGVRQVSFWRETTRQNPFLFRAAFWPSSPRDPCSSSSALLLP